MTELELYEIISSVKGLDADAVKRAVERQASLAKPPKSLGKLEEISIRLAGITGKLYNTVVHRRIIIMSSDNGVVEEGVASAPQSVTRAQTINFTRYKTGVSSMAKYHGVDICAVDVGVNADLPKDIGIVDRKIAYGTKNIAKGPAMTREQALRAIEIGIEMAKKAADDECEVIGIGEMGIGNTTTSASVLCALTGISPLETVGRGGCITDAMLANKIRVVERALAVNEPEASDVIGTLAKVGGFDIAAMTGAFIGAAVYRLPVVIDGYISAVAALCAYRLCPAVKDFLFPSHCSLEAGYSLAMNEIGIEPYLNLDMRLGEGSGCPLTFSIMETACAVMIYMATFEEAEINDDYLDEIRREME